LSRDFCVANGGVRNFGCIAAHCSRAAQAVRRSVAKTSYASVPDDQRRSSGRGKMGASGGAGRLRRVIKRGLNAQRDAHVGCDNCGRNGGGSAHPRRNRSAGKATKRGSARWRSTRRVAVLQRVNCGYHSVICEVAIRWRQCTSAQPDGLPALSRRYGAMVAAPEQAAEPTALPARSAMAQRSVAIRQVRFGGSCLLASTRTVLRLAYVAEPAQIRPAPVPSVIRPAGRSG
jgi:hypothetical protein